MRRFKQLMIYLSDIFKPKIKQATRPVFIILAIDKFEDNLDSHSREDPIIQDIMSKYSWLEIKSLNQIPCIIVNNLTHYSTLTNFKGFYKYLRKTKLFKLTTLIYLSTHITASEAYTLQKIYLSKLRRISRFSIIIENTLLPDKLDEYLFLTKTTSINNFIILHNLINESTLIANKIQSKLYTIKSDVIKNMTYYLSCLDCHAERIRFYNIISDIDKLESFLIQSINTISDNNNIYKKIYIDNIWLSDVTQVKLNKEPVTSRAYLKARPITAIFLILMSILLISTPYIYISRVNKDIDNISANITTAPKIAVPFYLEKSISHSALNLLSSSGKIVQQVNSLDSVLLSKLIYLYLLKNIHNTTNLLSVNSKKLAVSETQVMRHHLLNSPVLSSIERSVIQDSVRNQFYVPIFSKPDSTLLLQIIGKTKRLPHEYLQQDKSYQDSYLRSELLGISSINKLLTILNIDRNKFDLENYISLLKLYSRNNKINSKNRLIYIRLKQLVLQRLEAIANKAYTKSTNLNTYFTQYINPLKKYNLTSNISYLLPTLSLLTLENKQIILTPIALSSISKSVILSIGSKEISYNHGPTYPTAFSYNAKNSQCTVQFNDFNNHSVYSHFNNPNCLQKLIQQSLIYRKKHSVLITYRKIKHYIQFQISNNDYIRMTHPLHLPKHITIGATHEP
jgi:hypothetical protein